MMMGFWRWSSHEPEPDPDVTPVDRVTIEWLRFRSDRLEVVVVLLLFWLTLLVLPFCDLTIIDEEEGDEDEVVIVVVGDWGVVAEPL